MLKRLGNYEIEAEIGWGAAGVVYRARHPDTNHQVAIKTIGPLLSKPELQERFEVLLREVAALRHPNIVEISDFGADETEAASYIVMEYLEGHDLWRVISARAELDVARRLDIIAQACRGLHYAHQRGMVHGDLKPTNIFLTKEGTAKVMDFGIVRLSKLSNPGIVIAGRPLPLYMSPEHFRAKGVDARSDIFALGVILYELLTYQYPFMAPDICAVMFKTIAEPPPPLAKYLPNCPPELEKVVFKALEKDREARYQTAEEFALELEGLRERFSREGQAGKAGAGG